MRRVAGWLPSLTLASTLLFGSLAASAPAAVASPTSPLADTAGVRHHQIVLVRTNGVVSVIDPLQYSPSSIPGQKPFNWDSPDHIWQNVATGDFNGDGDDEIVAIGGNYLRVFDPFVQPGKSPVSFIANIYPYQWELVATGDLSGSGRKDIIATRTDSGDNGVVEQVVVFRPNADGSWSQVPLPAPLGAGFGARWEVLTVGDVNSDGKADILLARAPGNVMDLYRGTDFAQIGEVVFANDFHAIAATIGRVSNLTNRTDRNQIVVSRAGTSIPDQFPSFLVYQYQENCGLCSAYDNLQDFFQPFTELGAGYFVNDGRQDLAMLRSVGDTSAVQFAVRDVDAKQNVQEDRIQPGWLGLAVGNFFNLQNDQVVIVRPEVYRIYRNPFGNLTDHFDDPQPRTNQYTGAVAIGNIDGPGQPVLPTFDVQPRTFNITVTPGQPVPAQQVTIRNLTPGTGAIYWAAPQVAGFGWLSVLPTLGNTNDNPTAQLLINPAGLAAGTYMGVIRFTPTTPAEGGPIDVTVNLTVPPPQFNVSPTSLAVTYNRHLTYTQPQFNIQSATGSASVHWTAGAIPYNPTLNAALLEEMNAHPERVHFSVAGIQIGDRLAAGRVQWVILTPDEGNTPATVTVTFDESRIDIQNHVTIVVDGGSAASPRYRMVDLQVTSYPTSFFPIDLHRQHP